MPFLVRVESVGRLVHNKDRRIVQDGLGQSHPALVALRQGFDGLTQHLPQRYFLHRCVDTALAFRAIEAADLGDEAKIRQRRHVAIVGAPSGR